LKIREELVEELELVAIGSFEVGLFVAFRIAGAFCLCIAARKSFRKFIDNRFDDPAQSEPCLECDGDSLSEADNACRSDL
jgi:hypothetical protein